MKAEALQAGLIIGFFCICLVVAIVMTIKKRNKDKNNDDQDENLLGGGSIRSHRSREL